MRHWLAALRHPHQLSLRDLIAVVVPLALIVLLVFWAAYQFVRPAPPDWLVMTTGAPGGAYEAFGKRYQEILARDGVELVLRPSSGSLANLARLQDDDAEVDAGFMQSGVGSAAEAPGLVSLGALYYEPLWIIYRGSKDLDRLSQLKGRRIAIGPEGSGTRMLALQLLGANDIALPQDTLVPIGLADALVEFRSGKLDAAFVIAGADSPALQEMLRLGNARLMSMSQAPAYTRLFPFLSAVTLPQGSLDLVRNIPPRDTVLLSPTANLVVRDDLHPALMTLLIQAAMEVHGRPGLFQRAGEFPAAVENDFPLSDEAKRYYKSGPPFLQRYLPFWVADLVERLVVLIVPLIVVMIPLMRILPTLYTWRIKRRINRWYGELKRVEAELGEPQAASQLRAFLSRLDEIEQRASGVKVPLAYADLLYNLRAHIYLVRAEIREKEADRASGRMRDEG
jgi:TRAP transporter TAXI family solute receptor